MSLRMMISAALLVLTVFVSCGPSSGHASSGSNSGVQGRVVAGPTCPGPQRTSVMCPDPGIKTRVQAFSEGGRILKSVATDDHGRFRMLLTPGRYGLRARLESAVMPADPLLYRVVVRRERFAKVVIRLHTGLR
jgi:hypothetical protein